MYHPAEIQSLSKAQLKKLLTGGQVRIKSGKGQIINLSQEQHKKLNRAALKGSGCNIMLDPYQQDEVCGNGIKGAFKKLGSFVKGNKEAFRPLAKSLKQSGNEAIAQAAMRALDEGVDPSLVSAYANMSSSALQGPRQQGSGFIKKLNKFVKTPAVKTVRKSFRPLGQAMLTAGQDMAMQGLEQATEQAMTGMSGQGFIKKLNKFVKTPAVKTVRKAFRPLGEAMLTAGQDMAMQGLEQATEQAMGSMTGMGAKGGMFFTGKGIIKKGKKMAGSALYPAGYGSGVNRYGNYTAPYGGATPDGWG
jgi:hypothetical protein